MRRQNKNLGLIYLRRSGKRQELSLEMQLEWALKEAQRQEVKVDATKDYLEFMLENGLFSNKSIRLDNAVSGSDLGRPGFNALMDDALAGVKVTHLYIHKRDRFARP